MPGIGIDGAHTHNIMILLPFYTFLQSSCVPFISSWRSLPHAGLLVESEAGLFLKELHPELGVNGGQSEKHG